MKYIISLIGAIVVIIVLALVISNEDSRRQWIGGFLLLVAAFCLFLFDDNFQSSHQVGNQAKEDLTND